MIEIAFVAYKEKLQPYLVGLLSSIQAVWKVPTHVAAGEMDLTRIKRVFDWADIQDNPLGHPFGWNDMFFHVFMSYRLCSQDCILLDADSMIIRPMDWVFSYDFDLAYGIRTRKDDGYPINLVNVGFIAASQTQEARAFMEAWEALTVDIRSGKVSIPPRGCGK